MHPWQGLIHDFLVWAMDPFHSLLLGVGGWIPRRTGTRRNCDHQGGELELALRVVYHLLAGWTPSTMKPAPTASAQLHSHTKNLHLRTLPWTSPSACRRMGRRDAADGEEVSDLVTPAADLHIRWT